MTCTKGPDHPAVGLQRAPPDSGAFRVAWSPHVVDQKINNPSVTGRERSTPVEGPFSVEPFPRICDTFAAT
jgi:hypothetical protein